MQGDCDLGGDELVPLVSTGDVLREHQLMETFAAEEFENPQSAGISHLLVLRLGTILETSSSAAVGGGLDHKMWVLCM